MHEKPGENFNFSINPEFLAICSKSFRTNDTAECILKVHLPPKYKQTNLTLFTIISIVLGVYSQAVLGLLPASNGDMACLKVNHNLSIHQFVSWLRTIKRLSKNPSNSFKIINYQLLRAETASCNSHILHYTKVPTFSDRRVATSCDTYKTPYVPIIPILTKQLQHVFFTTIISLTTRRFMLESADRLTGWLMDLYRHTVIVRPIPRWKDLSPLAFRKFIHWV